MEASPQFLQGVYRYEGNGLEKPFLLDEDLIYEVPSGLETQLVYFRAGNSSDELVYAVLLRDGEPMRYFPIGARASTHVPLRVVEDLLSGTRLEVHVAAPAGSSGFLVVDIGMVEI
ncbi:MAG TPA: molybdopterin oxidoreductase [Actinomycetota bacterium]|nr:molybdopterin oxidoreductase [Actinomycetota bacterium]